MSTDPTQPAQPPARPSAEPPDEPAPPTVRMPVQQAAGQDPPGRVPPSGPDPSPGPWQEPATAPAPAWQPAPPPAPPGPRPQQATVRQPVVDPTVQQPAPGRAAQDPLPATQRVQEPWQQQQPSWQPHPAQWQEPRDTPPPAGGGQWAPQPPQAGGQWPPQPQQPPQAGGQWPPVPTAAPRQRRRQRRRRMRRSVMVTFTVLVILIVLVIGDRVACAITENEMASQFVSNGLPVKPAVNIEGFPFLTQLAAKDFKKVDISASNVPAGPVTISTVHATINGLHISGFSSSAHATVDHITATAFVSFGELAAAGGLGGGTGITVTQDGTDKLKISAGIGGIFSGSEEAQITQTGPQTISVKVINDGSAVGSLLSSFGSFSFSLPKGVPASLRITGLTLNSQGLTVSAAATNATFSQ